MLIPLTREMKDRILPLLNSYYYEADEYMKGFRNAASTNWDYYHSRLPILANDCVVPYYDKTCKTLTKSALKDLTEIFLSNNHEPVLFVAEGDDDPNLAVAATKLVRQVFNDNNGESLFHNAFLESLVVGASFLKRTYEVTKQNVTTGAKNLASEDEALSMVLAWKEGGLKIEDADVELTQNEDGTFNLKVSYEGDFESCKIALMPIEEVLFDQQATDIQDCTYFCHRVRKTKSELLSLGFKQTDIDTLNISEATTDDYYNVNQARSNGMRYDDQDIGADSEDKAVKVWVKEHYIRTGLIDESKTPQLYKIVEAGGVLLDEADIVAEIPVSVFVCDPLPGQIIGESLVEFVSDCQDILSWIKRDALKHTSLTANPRWIVQGDAVDKRSLQNNIPNSVIDVDVMGSIERLDPPPMDQGVQILLQLALDEAERRTGINSTQQGNVTNMLETNRQSEGTVQNLLTLAQSKVRNMGRNLGYGGVADLFKAIYRLMREQSNYPVSVLTAGGVIKVEPSKLPDFRFVRVDVALTSQEKMKKAAALMQLEQYAQMVDPQGQFTQPQNVAYKLYQMAESLGLPNYHDFFLPIEAYQPPQQAPGDQLAMMKAQAEIEHLQSQSKSLVQDAHVKTEDLAFRQQLAADETQYKSQDLTFRMQKAADETHLGGQRLQRDIAQDQLRYAQHADKHATDEYRAETENLKVQSQIMLESRKNAQQSNIIRG